MNCDKPDKKKEAQYLTVGAAPGQLSKTIQSNLHLLDHVDALLHGQLPEVVPYKAEDTLW
jgi:hypothetical protein